jgi:transposase
MSYKPYVPGQRDFFGYDPVACLGEDDPAFLLGGIVPKMDLRELKTHEGGAGQPPYHPAMLLSLWVYGMMRGIISSRQISAACGRDMGFMYLAAGASPCFKTLCNFRNQNAEAIRRLMAEALAVCRAMGLSIVGRLVLDSTRIKANSNRDNLIRARDYDEALKAIGAMLGDSESKDADEDSLYGEEENGYLLPDSVKKSLKNLEALQSAIKQAQKEGRKAVSPTDVECREMRESNTGKIVPGYSMQVAVDKASGLITVCDVVNEQSDNAFAPEAVRQHERNTGEKPVSLEADSGYFSADALKDLESQGVDACIPDQQTAREMRGDKEDKKAAAPGGEEPKITINDFQPVEGEDAWVCPAGRTLKRRSLRVRDGRTYRIYRAQTPCRDCPLSRRCLRKSDEGFRLIEVDENHLLIRANRARFQDEAHKARYRERGGWIERIFGHARRNVGLVQWLHNGLEKLKPTAIFLAIAHNMRLLGRHIAQLRQRGVEAAQKTAVTA